MQYSQEQQKELALNARQGDKEALQQLWESIYLLLFRMCLRCYYSCKEQADRSGATSDDFLQISYFAFLDAVKWYDPAKGYAFTAFLKYPVKNHINSLLGIRSHYRDALNYADSLNEPLDGEEPDGAERLDMVADEIDCYEPAEERVYREQLHKAVIKCLDQLPERESRAITGLYLEGKTLREMSAEMGLSPERIRQIKSHGFRTIRRTKDRGPFRGFYELYESVQENNAYKRTSWSAYKYYGASSVELTAEKMERLERKWRARFGDLRWSSDQSGSRQGCEACNKNSPLQFNGCSQIGTGEGSLK